MTFAELNTPFIRRRIIHYGKDGNKVVRHWYEMQHITGPLYKSREDKDGYGNVEYDMFLLFDGVKDGLLYERRMAHPELNTVEQYAERLERYKHDTLDNFLSYLDSCVKENRHIGGAMIEFTRQVDTDRAERYARHRELWLEAQEKRHQELMAQREAVRLEKEQQRREAERAERAKLLGWADDMSPMQFGRVSAFLDGRIRENGKIMTRRDFIIGLVRDGWTPHKSEGVISYYGSRWEPKKSAPRTEYSLRKEGMSYTVAKTEYDFALYLVNRSTVA